MDLVRGFQDRVQAAVLRAVEAGSVLDTDIVRRLYPQADHRDIRRAIDVLVDGGFMVVSRPAPGSVGTLPSVALTETGKARLAAEHGW